MYWSNVTFSTQCVQKGDGSPLFLLCWQETTFQLHCHVIAPCELVWCQVLMSMCYFEYWCSCFSKIIPHLVNTLKMDWLHHYTTLCTASNTNGLLQHSLLPGVFVQLLISKVSHEAILWLPLQMTFNTLVFQHYSLRDLHGHILISHNNVSIKKKKLNVYFYSCFKTEPVVWNLPTSQYNGEISGTKTMGNGPFTSATTLLIRVSSLHKFWQ